MRHGTSSECDASVVVRTSRVVNHAGRSMNPGKPLRKARTLFDSDEGEDLIDEGSDEEGSDEDEVWPGPRRRPLRVQPPGVMITFRAMLAAAFLKTS